MTEPVNQNTAATDGKSFPETGKKLPDAPNGGGTAGYVLVPRQATKAMLDAAYAAHDAYEAADTGGWGGLGSAYAAMIAEAPAFAAAMPSGGADLGSYLHRQWSWSKETFGPALRTKGIVQHITKELREIEADPHDLTEWVDVIILAMDGFWRHGGKPEDLLPAMQAKQDKNFARQWPDWRTMGEDQAIEHDRSGEVALAGEAAQAAETEGLGPKDDHAALKGQRP